ncbi:MAG: hypothetical protein D3906_11795 [Candidatus Electrothrix sp. AUS1_2]|nr:hypothetical protein [Candidatus Electrothrix sp. AUS1_2]
MGYSVLLRSVAPASYRIPVKKDEESCGVVSASYEEWSVEKKRAKYIPTRCFLPVTRTVRAFCLLK